MAFTKIEVPPQVAARVAGLAYLITFAIVVSVNFGIHERLIVDGNGVETARRILAHEALFRAGIAGDILYCAGMVVLLAALYVILKAVNRGLALLAALWRFVWVLMWLAMTLNLFDALRLLRGTDSLGALGADRIQGLAMFYLEARFDYYYVGLLFGSLASTLCAYLWWKSDYVPRVLAVFGIGASAWCVACTLIFYVFPGFDRLVNLWWFDTPMGLFDLATGFWLLFKGLRLPAVNANG
jgi:hypothetical protein